MYIYTITSLNKYIVDGTEQRLIYVGSTTDYESRFADHKSVCFNEKSQKYNLKVYRYIRQYGLDNFVFEVIEVLDDTTTDEELVRREQFYIDKYDSKNSMNTFDAIMGLDKKEYNRLKQAEYRKKNPDKYVASAREWVKNNRDKRIIYQRKCDAKRSMWKRAVKELSIMSCFE